MQIPPFQLPSNPEKFIYLREATVEDCEFFAETDSDQEEVTATQVLDLLQSDPERYVDPRTMTADDRRLAAFWYFISTTHDTTIHAPYECPHCGEQHDPLIEMKEVGAQYRPITGRAWREIEHDGKQLRVIPQNGYLMEELEALRLQVDDSNRSKMDAVIERHSLVGTLLEQGKTGDRDSQIEAMEKWVRSLTLRSYQELKAKRDDALAQMKHGLNTAIHGGEMVLLIDGLKCEKKEDPAAVTRLRFPFRMGEMLPRLL